MRAGRNMPLADGIQSQFKVDCTPHCSIRSACHTGCAPGVSPCSGRRRYPVQMLRLRPITALAILLLCPWTPALAAKIAQVEIHGLNHAMQQNVRLALSLVDALGEDISDWRLRYLLRVAEGEARKALEPFGYYAPVITLTHAGDAEVRVRVAIDPGEPVRVRNADIAIVGAGSGDAVLQQDIARFIPAPGAVFKHADYEASKLRISRHLASRGYFDAGFAAHRVTVSRADMSADIDLVWSSGERYTLGELSFTQSRDIIGEPLLRKLAPWQVGQAYDQQHLDGLRSALGRLEYFSQIDIDTPVKDALARQIPVKVSLAPAKRTVYTTGVSYGTDSGSGFRLGVERRYVNPGGHKLSAQLDYAQTRKSLTTRYRIPAFAWRDGWYTLRAQGYDEQSSYIDTRRIEVSAGRSAQYSPALALTGTVHVLHERWVYDLGDGGIDLEAVDRPLYRRVDYSYPSLRADYTKLDDRLFPRRGVNGSLALRSGINGMVADASFLQAHARASGFFGMGEWTRLILRAEAGVTWTSELGDLPPSLRFYAGGERSIRGYDFREVGPRLVRFTEDANGVAHLSSFYALGAKNVLTGSVELEHYFRSNWGAAVFVDSGSAFDGPRPEWRTGAGIGLRWKSPVGPLRLDLARGLNDPDSPFTVGLGIGAEF